MPSDAFICPTKVKAGNALNVHNEIRRETSRKFSERVLCNYLTRFSFWERSEKRFHHRFRRPHECLFRNMCAWNMFKMKKRIPSKNNTTALRYLPTGLFRILEQVKLFFSCAFLPSSFSMTMNTFAMAAYLREKWYDIYILF